MEILRSEIEPRDLILLTARKFIKAEVDKGPGRDMQDAFREYLNEKDCHHDSSTSYKESSEIDEGYLLDDKDKGVFTTIREFQIGDDEPKLPPHK